MSQKKIIITGGPSTGKTSIINSLKAAGFYCFDEFIRTLTQELKPPHTTSRGTNPIVLTDDSLVFNTRLMQGRLQQYRQADKAPASTVFFDRGIIDVLAYMVLFEQDIPSGFEDFCNTYRYDKVFILPPWEGIYQGDSERLESFEQCVLIHQSLERVYTDFGYRPITVPWGRVAERHQFIINS